ncbi:hypothetical protein HDU76_003815, partial [Blyttiomyces sp. JEL0837]
PNRDFRGPTLQTLATISSDVTQSIYTFQFDSGVANNAISNSYTFVGVHQHCDAPTSSDATDVWTFVPFNGTAAAANSFKFTLTSVSCPADKSRYVGSYGVAFCTAADSTKCPSVSGLRSIRTYSAGSITNARNVVVGDFDLWAF